MRSNRIGSADRDSRMPPPGYSAPPPPMHGAPPPYGGYPAGTQYSRGGGQSGATIPPPYGAPPDRIYRDEHPRMDDRVSGPGPVDRYDAPAGTMNSSARGHYGAPPYDPRASPDSEGKEKVEINANHGPPPPHAYTDVMQGHRYPPPSHGPPAPAGAMDHHGRRPSPTFQGAYPPPYDAEPRGRYGAYEGGASVRDNAPSQPPAGRQSLPPQSHASVIGDDFKTGSHYRYGEPPRDIPRDDRVDHHYESVRHAEKETADRSRRLSDIAPSPDGIPPPQTAASPNEITSNHRDDVVNTGCTCKKSKCLKLYCQCFAASVMCGPNCRCLVCHNTPRHAYVRKEAIRAILARNPQAFETKFKSTDKVATAESGRVVAHKSGCKCRKSQCLKKYCECYHGGVKCSASCRCIDCRNMPPGGLGPGARPDHSLVARSFAADVYSMKNKYGNYTGSKEQDRGVAVDAAQNLTFLKSGSPHRPEPSRSNAQEYPPVPSMTSTDTSPDVAEGVPTSAGDKQQGGKVNALLMAAYAMTELTNPSQAKEKGRTESGNAPPEARGSAAAPEKAVSEDRYRSPKRKCDDDIVSAASAISQVGSIRTTPENNVYPKPTDERMVKRGRFEAAEMANVADTKGVHTPESSRGTTAVTPVSARCIDFRHMDMNGRKEGQA